jgi:hypothetical protein
MIRINLLPHHLRPIKRSPIPYLVWAAFFVLCMGYIALSFLATEGQILAVKADLARHQDELAKLEAIVKESNELEASKLQLADRIATIQEIIKDKIIWSRELWNLSRLTPPNVWYSDIAVVPKNFETQIEEMDPKTGKPKIDPQTKRVVMKRIQVTRPILRVSGYITNSEDGTQDLGPLTDALTSDPEFSKTFQLEQPSFENAQFEGFDVKKFTLEFLINPGEGAA